MNFEAGFGFEGVDVVAGMFFDLEDNVGVSKDDDDDLMFMK